MAPWSPVEEHWWSVILCDETVEKMQQLVYWYGMSTDVTVQMATCDACSQNERQKANLKAPLQSYQSSYPNYRVHLDMLGPSCEILRGQKYVSMVIDHFARFLEMIPLKTQKADEMAKAFFDGYVVRFGVPFIISRVKCSERFAAWWKCWKLPPQCIDLVQAARWSSIISFVTSFLRCFLSSKHSEWDTFLLVLGMSICSIINRSTGDTPNFFSFRQEINLPVDIVVDFLGGKKHFNSQSEFLKELMPQIAATFMEVGNNIKRAQHSQKKLYDENINMREFDVGDFV